MYSWLSIPISCSSRFFSCLWSLPPTDQRFHEPGQKFFTWKSGKNVCVWPLEDCVPGEVVNRIVCPTEKGLKDDVIKCDYTVLWQWAVVLGVRVSLVATRVIQLTCPPTAPLWLLAPTIQWDECHMDTSLHMNTAGKGRRIRGLFLSEQRETTCLRKPKR